MLNFRNLYPIGRTKHYHCINWSSQFSYHCFLDLRRQSRNVAKFPWLSIFAGDQQQGTRKLVPWRDKRCRPSRASWTQIIQTEFGQTILLGYWFCLRREDIHTRECTILPQLPRHQPGIWRNRNHLEVLPANEIFCECKEMIVN